MSKRLKAICCFVVLSVSVTAAVGCGSSSDESNSGSSGDEVTAEAPGLSGDPVKYGLLTGLTGDYSAFSDAVTVGSKLAIEDINSGGGVLKRPASLVIQDNKSTPEGAVSGFQKLTQVDKVVGVGGVESDGGVAVLERAAEQEIPVICSFCGTPVLDTKGGDFEWRFTASDTQGGAAIAQFARDAGDEKVAILAQEGEVGRPADIFKDIFENQIGGEVVSDVRIDPGKSSYQAEVAEAFSNDPDSVYLSVGHEAAASIFPEWQRRGYGGTFYVSPDLITPDTVFDFLEDGVATGTIAAFDQDTPAYKNFKQRMTDEVGHGPSEGLGEPLNYDSFITLALATQAAGSTNGAEINAQIPTVLNPPGTKCYLYNKCLDLLNKKKEINYEGASSSLDMTETGNLESPVMAKIQLVDGEWVPTERVELDPSLVPSGN